MISNISGAPPVTCAKFDSIPPDARLTTRQLAEALTAVGLPTSPATLNTKACRGGGPPYQIYGRIRIYMWGAAVKWALSLMGEPSPNATARRLKARARADGKTREA